MNLKSPKKNLSRELSFHKTSIILIVLIIIGAIFRINGVGFGLPMRLHPDEVVIVENAVAVAASGNLDPRMYNWPTHVSIYLHALFYKSYSAVRCFLFHDCEGTGTQFLNNPSPYVFLSRMITACVGTLMILSMFFLGKEVGGGKVGLYSAALTAFFPSFIRHSHFVTPDIPLAFYISMVALFICKYMKRRKLVFLFLGCFFCALATAEKYFGILSTIIIFFGIVFSHRRKKEDILKLLPLSGVAFLFSLFFVAPFLFLKYELVIKAIFEEITMYQLGAMGLGWGGNLLYYIGTLLDNMGILLGLFFLLGLVLFVIKFKASIRVKHYLTISIFGFIYWVILSKFDLHWERWAVPMYIVPIIIASVGIAQLSTFLKKKKIRWSIIFTIFLTIMLSSLFLRGMMQSLNFSWKDTRVVSKHWITLNLPANSKMAADAYSPLKPNCCGSVAVKNLEEFKKEGIEYVIVSSSIYKRIFDEKDRYPNEVIFYKRLFESEYLVKEFSPAIFELGKNDISAVYKGIKKLMDYMQHKEVYLRGPVIKIYRISEERE